MDVQDIQDRGPPPSHCPQGGPRRCDSNIYEVEISVISASSIPVFQVLIYFPGMPVMVYFFLDVRRRCLRYVSAIDQNGGLE